MIDLDLLEHTDTINELLARYGVKFGIYKNHTFRLWITADMVVICLP